MTVHVNYTVPIPVATPTLQKHNIVGYCIVQITFIKTLPENIEYHYLE